MTFCFAGCATQSGRVITMDSYLEVHNGETRAEILSQFGEPLSIELKDDGTEIFTYIERFSMNGKVVEARYYYFYIKGDKVVGKIANTVDRPQSINSDDF
jgi:outer membrane protein assembly factor BamE (lipoprotein component of BamABCDE complex)